MADKIGKYGLTRREAQIYDLILQGFSKREIADLLSISLTTVFTHFGHIYKKTNLHSYRKILVTELDSSKEYKSTIRKLKKEIKSLKLSLNATLEVNEELSRKTMLYEAETDKASALVKAKIQTYLKKVLETPSKQIIKSAEDIKVIAFDTHNDKLQILSNIILSAIKGLLSVNNKSFY